MRRLATVFSREYLSCMMRPATWGVLIAALAFTLLDSLPTDANLARVELLPVPSFFANRIMSVSGLVLVTGLVILLSSRLARDKKAGVKSLLMASPLSKGEYLLGKLLAGFFFSLSLMGLYLTVCMAAYALAIPAASASSMFEYGYALVKAFVFLGVPVSFFVSMCAVALPAVMDTRVFYLIFFALILVNVVTVGSADSVPFYLITSGDLAKLIWQHPVFPFHDAASIAANLAFLVGAGIAAVLLACLNPRFWRA